MRDFCVIRSTSIRRASGALNLDAASTTRNECSPYSPLSRLPRHLSQTSNTLTSERFKSTPKANGGNATILRWQVKASVRDGLFAHRHPHDWSLRSTLVQNKRCVHWAKQGRQQRRKRQKYGHLSVMPRLSFGRRPTTGRNKANVKLARTFTIRHVMIYSTHRQCESSTEARSRSRERREQTADCRLSRENLLRHEYPKNDRSVSKHAPRLKIITCLVVVLCILPLHLEFAAHLCPQHDSP